MCSMYRIHVRETDKVIFGEASNYSIDKYVSRLTTSRYFNSVVNRTILMISDNPARILEARRRLGRWSLITRAKSAETGTVCLP